MDDSWHSQHPAILACRGPGAGAPFFSFSSSSSLARICEPYHACYNPGVEGFGYSSNEELQPSAKLTLFFKGVAAALQQLRERIPKQLADESRSICAGVLEKVLVKVAFRNPGLNLTNVLRKLPADADLDALKALVAPIVDRVNEVKRVDGGRVD